MNKSLLIGLIVGAGATAGAGALGNLALKRDYEKPATAIAVESPVPLHSPTDAVVPDAQVATQTPQAPVTRIVRKDPEFVRVVSVQPLSRTVSEPRQVCNDVEVEKPAPVRDQHQVAGSIVGGVIGGVIGNQIGDGDGRKIARIAGALGGAYAGNKVQERIQASRTVKAVEQQCETVYEPRELPDGYNVTYEWDGGTRTERMPNDPGSRLPVRGGEVILASYAR
jgi:uncharacterized protein YcfJ